MSAVSESYAISKKQLLNEQEWDAHTRALKLLCSFDGFAFVMGKDEQRSRSQWKALRGLPKLDQWIYFIQAGGPRGPVKIGIAQDPEKRLRSLQAAHYEDLWLRAIGPGDRWAEGLVHSLYSETNLRGEWFAFSDELGEHMGRLFKAYGRKLFEFEGQDWL